MKKLVFIFLVLASTCTYLAAQLPAQVQAQATQELEKLGITEAELRTALLAKGIDIDKVDITNPAEVAKTEAVIRATTDEILAAKKTSLPLSKDTIPQAPANSTPAVKPTEVNVKAKPDSGSNLPTNSSISGDVFGHDIFKKGNLKIFGKVEDGRPSSSYILGPGDKVTISIWGASLINVSQEIGKEGYIQPNGISRLSLSGLTIAQAEKVVRETYSRRAVFNNDQFSFTVTSPRGINVNIYGEVFTNGTFTLSAMNTAFNALIAAGGPNDIGSVRKITLQRAGQKPKILDVYAFLKNPSIANDFALTENDFIHVPVQGSIVAIEGAITRPYRYELLATETLADLVALAGGLTAQAYTQNVSIKRFEDGIEKVINLDFQKEGSKILLKDGDRVVINAVSAPIKNFVSINGAVEFPNEYAISPSSKLTDVLALGKIKETAILNQVYIRRFNADQKTVRYRLINAAAALANPLSTDNIVLQNGDVIIISDAQTFTTVGTLSIEGAVNQPGTFTINAGGGLSIKDAIYLSGGLKDNAIGFAYLFSTPSSNQLITEYKYIDLSSKDTSLLFSANDRLYIYSKEEFTNASKVSISGAIKNAGEYVYNPTLTLKDLITLAGGLTIEAAPNKIDIYTVQFEKGIKTKTVLTTINLQNSDVLSIDKNIPLAPFDQVIIRSMPEFALQRNIQVAGEVTYPGTFAALDENTRISNIIKQAGGLTNKAYIEGAQLTRSKDNVGNIVIDLKKAMDNPNTIFDFILKDGDQLTIPENTSVVALSGATNYSAVNANRVGSDGFINIGYVGNKSAKYYIDNYAGGFSSNADRSRLTVTYQNGKVKKAGNFLFFRTYPKMKPGAKVNVPFKIVDPLKEGKPKEDIDWGKVLASSVAQATSVLSLVLLLRAIN